jgi:glycosyltransferase involved in cell wall biosynthesis
MKVSIILPTYNRLDRLQRVIAAIRAQTVDHDQFELIVVSDGSQDGTDAYLAQLALPFQFTAVFQQNQGVAATRNHGLEKATGELVLFVDDDVVPSPQLLAEHLKSHAQYGGQAVVMGPMLTPPDFDMAPWVLWEQAMLEKQYRSMIEGHWQPTARQFYTGNTSLARRHIVAAGGFDPAFRRAEDVELAYRLADMGLDFYFNPQAVGHHYAERSFASWIAIPYAYGRNDVIFHRDKGQNWLLERIFSEYHGRHHFVRALSRVCLDRTRLSETAVGAMRRLAQWGHRAGVAQLPRMAYSGIFNLRHYQGIADELGGRAQFFQQVELAAKEPNDD